jgi:hypothetical protein
MHRGGHMLGALLALVATAAPAQAQGTTSPFANLRFGVALEGYYQVNTNRPPDRVIPLRAYDTRSNTFSIQQTVIVIESAVSVADGRRFGGRVDLQFGQATETVQGNAGNEPRPDAYRHLWQAYGTYVFPVGRGLTADFGKFGSNLGYETNYAKDNSHFSRALLFNGLPFYHMGVRVTLPVSDTVTLMYALTNGIQQTEDFNNFKSSHATVIIKPSSRVIWTTSYYIGKEQPDAGAPGAPDGVFTVVDSYLTYTATAALTMGLDVNHVSNHVERTGPSLSMQGTGAYARYQLSAPAALAVRYERVDDDGLLGGVTQLLQELTATLEHKFAEGFLLRAEVRSDWSDARFFPGPEPGDSRRRQHTALLGLVWWFGNKQGTW